VHQKVGQGSIYFVTTLPIGDWSGLDQGPVLLPMLQRMSQDGTRRLESTLYWTCGEISEIDLEAGWQPVEEGSEHRMAWHAGVYRLGDRLAAVNTPASEYDLAITTQEEVEPLFEDQNFQMFQDKAGQGDTKLQGEIWRVFLFLMLLFLLVESWLMMTGPGTVAQTAFLKKVQPSTTGGAS
jgi:hypothetical protein